MSQDRRQRPPGSEPPAAEPSSDDRERYETMRMRIAMRRRAERAARQAPTDGGKPLPAPLQHKMGNALGVDLSPVRVHEGEHVAAAGARAFARGTDVHFAPSEYRPESPDGQAMLGHELAHLAQQSRGDVASDGAIDDSPAREQEADRLGTTALAEGAPPATELAPLQHKSGDAPIQRTKADANAYVKAQKLSGFSSDVTKAEVQAYVNNKSNPRQHRINLADEWNRGQPSPNKVQKPTDLEDDDMGSGSGSDSDDESKMDMSGGGAGTRALSLADFTYSSDEDDELPAKEHSDLRRRMSDGGKEEAHFDIEKFRTSTTRIERDGGYGFTSSANSNLVSAPGFNTAQSEYKNVIGTLRGLTGSDAMTAEMTLSGLFNQEKFEQYLGALDKAGQDKAQFLVALLINEIFGRSLSNLLEIVTLLNKTIQADDDELFRRLAERGLFVPTGKAHGGIGGQKLSRIGHGELDEGKLDGALKGVLTGNRELYASLMVKLGCKDAGQLLAYSHELFKKFVANQQKTSDVYSRSKSAAE